MGERANTRIRKPGGTLLYGQSSSAEWPAWFSFWFSGCWRALAKGTAWAGFYCAIHHHNWPHVLGCRRAPVVRSRVWRCGELLSNQGNHATTTRRHGTRAVVRVWHLTTIRMAVVGMSKATQKPPLARDQWPLLWAWGAHLALKPLHPQKLPSHRRQEPPPSTSK